LFIHHHQSVRGARGYIYLLSHDTFNAFYGYLPTYSSILNIFQLFVCPSYSSTATHAGSSCPMYILNSEANSLKHHYVMTKSETNELSMAASYCRLYQSRITRSPPPRSPGEEEPPYCSTLQQPPSNDFWQHDTWTDEDYQSAEALLQANISRSTLPQHRVDKHVQNSKDWDSFYSRNQTKFYNDRHYLQR